MRICDCKGKYGCNFGKDHCAKSEHACQMAFKKSMNQTSIKEIEA